MKYKLTKLIKYNLKKIYHPNISYMQENFPLQPCCHDIFIVLIILCIKTKPDQINELRSKIVNIVN